MSPLDELKNSWGKRSEICLNNKTKKKLIMMNLTCLSWASWHSLIHSWNAREISALCSWKGDCKSTINNIYIYIYIYINEINIVCCVGSVQIQIQIAKSNVSSVGPSSERNTVFSLWRRPTYSYTNLFILQYIYIYISRQTVLFTVLQSK